MQINGVEFNVELTDILNELKQQLEINNIPLLNDIKDSGDNVMVTCPYHKGGQERRPSAGILKSDGVFHCLACGETHTLQEVISHCFGKDDLVGTFGWNWLLKNFLTISVENRHDIELDFKRDSERIDEIVKTVTEEELDGYRYYHPYMWKRKLTKEIVEVFDIGYDKNTDCITFPVRNQNGAVLFVARRSTKGKYFNYPSGAEKPVYGLYELYSLDTFPSEVVVCESMLDALTVWVYGGYAVALNGLGTHKQFEQLNRMPCRKIILATDNDSAGMKARRNIRKNCGMKLISEYLLPSDIKDMNDLSYEQYKNLKEIY